MRPAARDTCLSSRASDSDARAVHRSSKMGNVWVLKLIRRHFSCGTGRHVRVTHMYGQVGPYTLLLQVWHRYRPVERQWYPWYSTVHDM